MAKVNPEILEAVQEALHRYVDAVEASRLSPESKKTYKEHPANFVRWLDDDFEPGANVR